MNYMKNIKEKTIVVGGGISGLTAAITLAKNGKNVLLIEKNDYCGGLMNTFEKDGFRFDGGARAIVNSGLFSPMVKEFELDLELIPNPITLIIEDKKLFINGLESIDAYSEILKELYPNSHVDIDKIIDAMRSIIEDMKVLYGVDNPLFSKNKRKIILAIPSIFLWMIKLMGILHKMDKMKIPVEEFLDSLTSNHSLKDIISQHFFKGTPTFFALSYFALYNDYLYPKGGVGTFPKKLAEKIVELGGEIKYNTEINKVDISQKELTDTKGNVYKFDKLIWAADLKTFYKFCTNVPNKLKKKYLQIKEKVLSSKGSESVFSLFIAVNRPAEFFANVGTGHLFYTPRKEGLGELHRSKLTKIKENFEKLEKKDLFSWLKAYCEYNTFEISIPVLRYKDAAPNGKAGLEVSLLFDYELTTMIYERGWYEDFKQKMSEYIIEILSEKIYENLKDDIIFTFSSTPMTIKNIVGSSEGAIVGWSFEQDLPIESSMIHMAKAIETPFNDVYVAGQWTFSPAGGPTAIMTGRMAANRCMRG